METPIVDKPAILNGAILTKDVLNAVNFIQTGGTRGQLPDKIDNYGFKYFSEKLNSITDYLLAMAMDKGTEDERKVEMDLLLSVWEIKETLKHMTAPEGDLLM